MEFTAHFSFDSPENLRQLLFHPALNTVFGCSHNGRLYCFDTTSGNLIKWYEVSDEESRLLLALLPNKDRLIVCHGRKFNARTELNGTLLLESILQTKVQSESDSITIDLSHVDAVYLLSILKTFDAKKYEDDIDLFEFYQFLNTLEEAVTESEKRLNLLPTKLTRWETVSLKTEFSVWKATIVVVLKNILPVNTPLEPGMPQGASNPNYQDVPGLPVIAAIMDRLQRLGPPGVETTQQGSIQIPRTMNAEVDRRATFTFWPHMDYKWALPDQMAQAGFFQSSGSAEAEDRALCFICRVCLVCWESTDEPWAEHERHSENCPFVKGQYTHNIPIRVTHGTETAVCLRDHHSKIVHLSSTNSHTLIATAAADGEIIVWDLTLRIRQVARFNINKVCEGSSSGQPGSVTITSLCLLDVTSPRAREMFVHEHLLVVGTIEQSGDQRSTAHLYSFEIRQVIQVLVGRPQFLGKYSQQEPEIEKSEDEGDPPSFWDSLLTKLYSKEPKHQHDQDYIMGYDDVDEEIAGITSNTGVEVVISSESFDVDLDVSPPVTSNTLLDYVHTGAQSQRSLPTMEEWNRLNYCLGEYRCSGHCIVESESDVIVKQIMPYPGTHRHPSMFICLFNTTSPIEEYSSHGGIIVFKGVNDELSRVVFMNENTPIQACPIEPDPCDPDVTPSTSGGGICDDSDDAIEPVPPKKTKSTSFSGEDHIGMTSCSSVVASGRRLPSAVLAVVTAGGDLAIIDVQRCENHFAARYAGNFTCIEFCSGMDRICAASSDGKVHFMSIGGSEVSDENNHPELGGMQTFEETVSDKLEGAPIVGQSAPGTASSDSTSAGLHVQSDLFDDPDLLVNSVRENLGLIHELVQYEPLVGRVHVSLPPCWSQMEREEHQPAPSNIGYPTAQMINLGLGSSSRIIGGTTGGGPPGGRAIIEAFVGSWKLTPDGSTWREHVMEIVFPKVISVGHIDLKFRLQDMVTGNNVPQSIYVTLLRQNVSSQTSPSSLGANIEATGQGGAVTSGFDALITAACMQQEIMSGAEIGLTLSDLDAPFIDEDSLDSPGYSQAPKQPPPISESQLRQLNAEVIAGPYRLSDYIDLSGQVAVIPLTSVDLMKVRTRFYAVYIHTPIKEPHVGYRRMVAGLVNSQATTQRPSAKQGDSAERKAKSKAWGEMMGNQPSNFQVPHLGAASGSKVNNTFSSIPSSKVSGGTSGITSSTTKATEWYGCDIIRQITLTIHRFKRIQRVPRERLQRMAILRNNKFHVHLVDLLLERQLTQYNTMRVLDILNWIVVMYANDIHMKRSSILHLLSRVIADLNSIIRYCLIGSDRSTAKKAAKFLLQLLDLEKNGLIGDRKMSDVESVPSSFHTCLLDCLMNNLPLLLLSDSPAGVRWFFFLLGRLGGLDIGQASQNVACMIRELARLYRERTVDLNLALLRSDFGIFSNPLDPVLFDIDASTVLEENRSSSSTTSNNDSLSGKPQSTLKAGSTPGCWDYRGKSSHSSGELFSNSDLLKDLLPLLSTNSSYDFLYDEADWRSCGLTETEPLHFTCHTSSSDTKLERGAENMGLGSVNVPQPSQHLEAAFEPFFLTNTSPLYKAKQHQLMKLHLKKQLLEAKLSEAKKAVQQQHLQAFQTLTGSVQKPLIPLSTASNVQSPWHVPPTPQTTPAATADTTPKHCTPSVSPPNEGNKPGRSNLMNGPGPSRVAAAAAAAAMSSPLIKSVWCQHLLSPPAPHEIVMERNHGGARRFVVLDFGRMVYLTDVVIPSNEQLSSLSVDAWLHYEDIDGQRLAHVTDIATHPLILCDLQPPTVCRFLKITVCSSFKVATLTQRSRVQIGNFYGHSVPHPEAINTCASHPLIHTELEAHIQQVAAVLEDNRCRYGLARDLLRRQLRAYYPTTTGTTSSTSNVSAYSTGSTNNIPGPPPTISGVTSGSQESTPGDNAFARLKTAVQHCFVLQRLVNFSQRTLERLQRILTSRNPCLALLDCMSSDVSLSEECISKLSIHASTDKIRVLLEACLSYLLYCQSVQACDDTLSSSSFIQSLEVGQSILQIPGGDTLSGVFKDLIAFGTKRMQIMSCCLLSDLCCVASITKQLNLQGWLADWLGGMLRSFFAANSDQIVPRSRIFLLICLSLQRLISSGLGRLILTDLLKMLEELLSPLKERPTDMPQSFCFIDQELLNWMVLLTTKALDFLPRKGNEAEHRHQPRWEFLSWHHRQKRRAKRGIPNVSKNRSHGSSSYGPNISHSTKSIGKNSFATPDFNPKLIKRKLHKRLLHHREQLMNLTKSQEDFLNVTMAQHSDSGQTSSKSHFGGKEAAKLYIIKKKEDEFNSKLQLITKKHVKDMLQIRKNDLDICRRTKRSAKESFTGVNSKGTGSNTASLFGTQFFAAISSLTSDVGYSSEVLPCSVVKQQAIPVVRLLFTLLCRLDTSCSTDTFLRTCKLIGHIMRTCQPPLHLSEALREDAVNMLLHRFASASLVSSFGESWAGPYGLHAVACLFSDLLDSEEEHQLPSVKVKQEPLLNYSATQDESNKGAEYVRRTNESHPGKSVGEQPGDAATIEMDFLKQIDLFESDESDTTPENKTKSDDYVRTQPMNVLNDRMVEDSRTPHDLTQSVNVGELVGRFISSNFSSAYDCRLEHGLEWRQEIDLMRYMAQGQVSTNMTLVQPSVIANPLLGYEDENVIPEPEVKTDNLSTSTAKSLLSRCINDLICRQRSENLHLMPLLQMWLLLNQRSSQTSFETGVKRGLEDGFNAQNGVIGSGESDVDSLPPTGSLSRWVSVAEPTLSFTRKALGALLVSLTEEPHPLSVLHMGLRVLVLTSSQRGEDDIVPFLLTSPEFKGFLIRLLSVSPSDRRGNLVGPATLDLLEELILRLRLYCTNTSYSFAPFVAEILNKLMDVNSGPLFAGYGPIDLQCKWVLVVCEENFSKCDTTLLLNLVFGITQLAVRQLKLLTPSLTPQWSCSSNTNTSASGKENQNTKLDRGIPPPYVCFTSVCSSSGVLTKNDPDKAYEALCNRDRLVTALMSLLHHIVASSNSVDHSFDPEIKGNKDNRADEQKILDTHCRSATLADVIVGSGGNIQPVQQLLRILSLCMSNVFTGIGADLSLSELAKELIPHLQPRSIGDWTLLTLKQIYLHCTARHVFLDALLTFLSSSPASAIHEPLLLLVAWILTDETSGNTGNNMQYFLTQGGLRRVAYRFVELARYMIGTQSSCVRSTEIDLLTGDVSARLPLDEDSPANLAPVCVVKCISGGQGGSSSGSESLLQSTQAIHRRVKCAQWSYNFFPDESYTELYIRVPSPALLSELIVVPHLASLQSSPSAISFELHLDEALVYSLNGPVQTAGMPQVRITLPPTLANGVVLRLHRPCDVDSVGLSHIQLRGYSLFSAKLPHSDGLSPAFAWLRLLHFVLDTATVIPSPFVSPGALVGAVVDEVPALLPHLCAQITSSGADHATSSPSSIAESVLLNLGRLCPQASLHILRCLLKIPMSEERDLHLCPLFYQWEGVESNTGTENLIYRLTRERDEWMGERLSLLLQWLASVSSRLSVPQASDVRMEPLSSIVIPSLHIGCIAVVLWEVSTVESFDGSFDWRNDLVTEDLVNNVYDWYLNVGPQNPDMRRALACLMCSFCALSPNIFSQLLEWTKVSTMIGLTDDSKSILDTSASHAWPGCEQLEVLAVVSQSPACLPQLYSSGFLELLTNQLLLFVKYQLRNVPFLQPWGNFVGDIGADTDFHKLKKKKVQADSIRTETSTIITTEGASAILQFLTQIMESNSSANNWLGSAENTNFWKPLIALLMIGPSFQPPTHVAGGLADSDRISLEQAAIEYFVTVTRFSEVNQTQFSQIVCNALLTLASQVSGRVSGSEPMEDCNSYGVPLCLPSFLRRLILQVMLDEGRIEVLLRTSSDEDEYLLPRQSPAGLNHPELGAGYGRYIHQGVATETLATVAEKLLRRRSMLGGLLSGSKGSSCTTIASQTLLTNVPNMGPNEEKISVLPTQSLSGQLGQFSVSDFHTTTQALLLLDQISLSAGLNINMQKKDATVSSEMSEKNNPKTSNGSGKVSHPQPLHVDSSMVNNPTFIDGLVKFEFTHKSFGEAPLPLGCTLGQILIAISLTEGFIPLRLELTVRGNRFQKSLIINHSTSDTDPELVASSSTYSAKPTSNVSDDVTPLGWCLSLRKQPLTTLDTFAAINGLSALAELLHLLVPGICRLNMAGGTNEVISDLQKRQSSSLNVQSNTPQVQAADHCLWEDFTFSSDIDFDPYSDYLNSGGFISMTDLQSQVMIGASTRPGRAGPCPQGTLPALPAHTLIAFALFLRLNGYADLLLSRERRLAICLLRLMMGVTEDANGDSLLTRGDSRSLPQLPFTVLCQLLRTIPHGTDDAAVLQKRCLDLGIVELCLSSLAVLSHQEPVSSAAPSHPVVAMTVDALQAQMSSGRRKPDGAGRGIGVGNRGGSSSSHPNSVANTEQQTLSAQQQQKLYWAKGTGFGTGSTVSSWDAEQTLLRQRMEEEHCTAILHVLAAFIRPGPDILECSNDETSLPAFNTNEPSGLGSNSQRVLQMFQDSCLVAAMASYLRNDSVLDMARHVSLYRALLVVLRSLALDSELRVLLRIQSSDSSPTNISNLLASMKRCVDTYAARLKVGTKVSQPEPDAEMEGVTMNSEETIGDGTGLAQLIPDIQKTADLVEEALRPTVTCSIDGVEDSDERLEDGPLTKSSQDYCTRMKPLQFDTFKMIREKSDGSITFVVPHFHSSTIQHQHMTGTGGSVSRSRRLAQETVTLSTSLPLSESSSVFVRCDEDRLDVMKALITGPLDTPYANGCFEFDVYFPSDYPKSPPQVQLKTTGNQTVRFNPNLYNCGKVCLSILNTWHGRPEEKWSGKTSSFLQVLVSIQSLILVSEPYFNEPGYERSRGTPCGTIASRDYDANIRQATVRWAMLDMLRRPPEAFRQVVQNHFYLKKDEILKQVNDWITEMTTYTSSGSGAPNASGSQGPPPPPPPPGTPSSTSLPITKIPTVGSVPSAVTNSVAKHSLIQLKKYFAQLQEELNKLSDPAEFSPDDLDSHCVKQESVDEIAVSSSVGTSASLPQTSEMKIMSKGLDVVGSQMPPQPSQSIDEEPDDDGIIL